MCIDFKLYLLRKLRFAQAKTQACALKRIRLVAFFIKIKQNILLYWYITKYQWDPVAGTVTVLQPVFRLFTDFLPWYTCFGTEAR